MIPDDELDSQSVSSNKDPTSSSFDRNDKENVQPNASQNAKRGRIEIKIKFVQ